MRLTLPRLSTASAGDLLAGLRDSIPIIGESSDQERLSSLGASITYSFAHLSDESRRLLPVVSLFYGIADVAVLAVLSTADGVPGQFASITREEWTATLEDAARVGLLSRIGGGMYQVHPALPGYLAAGWHAADPDGYVATRAACEEALRTACADYCRWLIGQIKSGSASLAYTIIGLQRRTFAAMLGHALNHHAWDDADGIVRALDDYWSTRGFNEEATGWADRILVAVTGVGYTPSSGAESLWLYTIVRKAARQQDAGHSDQAANAYRQALAYLEGQPPTDWTRTSVAVLYHQLGIAAQNRGRLDEAEDWYRKSLTIGEDLEIRPDWRVLTIS